MNIYNITNGQLITLWVGGLFLWIGLILTGNEPYGGSVFYDLIGLVALVAIPVLLFFYTLGWRNHHKK